MNELWKMKCKADLYNLRKIEAAIESIPDEIALERDRMTAIKSASSGTSPVQGGGTSYEDRMNNSICLIDMLTNNLHVSTDGARLTKKALASLTEEEQRILTVLYIERQRNAAGRLCDELNCDERTVWRKAARALANYNAARHGI